MSYECKHCNAKTDGCIAYGLCSKCHNKLCNNDPELIAYFDGLGKPLDRITVETLRRMDQEDLLSDDPLKRLNARMTVIKRLQDEARENMTGGNHEPARG